jgi:very-short-patch-repair endonuclease
MLKDILGYIELLFREIIVFPPFVKGGLGGIFPINLPFNKDLKGFARDLRKNMTETEVFLWNRIRRRQLYGYQFYRQKNIGNYIVDFYCSAAKLVIELDGGQHYSESGIIRDKQRDDYLSSLGLQILRFSDREVFKNIEGIVEKICQCLLKSPPTPL